MVDYAHELGPKRSSRVLEQAMRMSSAVWAETIDESQPRSIAGRVAEVDDEVLIVQVDPEQGDVGDLLAGRYYQLVMNVGENRYLAVCDLVDAESRQEAMKLVFSRPHSLQVMQRRSFARTVPNHALSVRISWQQRNEETDAPALGQICDLSISGMSVRMPDAFDSVLFVGDTVDLRFRLDANDPEFTIEAVIRHKELLRDRGDLLLGIEFVGGDENDAFRCKLSAALAAQTGMKKGS